MPAPAVCDALTGALRRLGGDRWAVRSSAMDEDGGRASHAGQLASYLDVPADDVPARVADVWRSAFTPSVLAYRRAHGLAGMPAPPAVLVQRMVRPVAAGVAFSADPATGRRGVAVVAAVPGLADALVAGEATGQTAEVDAAWGVTRTGPDVLTDAQARRVAALARRLERHQGAPVDVEWALEDDHLWVLQCRPVTTLRAMPDPDGAPMLWDNSNIAESYRGVTTPLTYGFARTAYTHVYRAWLRLMGVSEARLAAHADTFRRLVGCVGGRIYYGLPAWYGLLTLLPGFRVNRGFMETMMGLKEALPADLLPPERPATRRERLRDALALVRTAFGLAWAFATIKGRVRAFEAHVADALAVPDPAAQRLDELAATYRRIEDRLLPAWGTPLLNDFGCMIAFGLTTRLAARWAPGAAGLGERLATPGAGVVSAEPAGQVRAMAARVRPDAAAVAALRYGSAEAAEGALRRHAADLLDAYLDRFGDRCLDELKLESPTLRDDPLPLLRSVGAVAARPEAPVPPEVPVATLLRDAGLSPVRRAVLGRLVPLTLAFVARRENLRFERTRVFGLARRLFREMGLHLAAEGVLTAPDDVFYLEPHELLGFVEGTATTTDLAGLVAVRRAEFARYHAGAAPADRFRTTGAVHVGNRFEGEAPPMGTHADGGERRCGMGAGPGVVEGRVRVVTDPRTAVLAPGDVLVAERTDPGWVTLFAACAGLVIERGSLLSHAAIVARELGLPAVVGLADARRWLRDGDRVRLDGATGAVQVLARAEDAAAEDAHAA
jgi:rifampicin phosphotransferase